MSLDPSLRVGNTLGRHRNVLNRAERLDKLQEDEKWDEGKSVYNLPKVGHRKAIIVKTVKEEVAAVPGAPVVAPAGGAKGAAPAAGAKGAAAPAAGAKGAPAGKAAAGKAPAAKAPAKKK